MYYMDVFDADLKNWQAGLLAGVARKQSGPDITSQTVLYMLNAAKAYANHHGGQFEPGFTQLLLSHRILFFEKPGQKRPSNCIALPSCRVLFGTTKLSFDAVADRIKSIVSYKDYKIKPCGNEEISGNYFIRDIDYSTKTIELNDNGNIVVVNPDNFKIVYSDFPEFNGDLLPALEEIMAPIQFSPILPAQREEFFGENR